MALSTERNLSPTIQSFPLYRNRKSPHWDPSCEAQWFRRARGTLWLEGATPSHGRQGEGQRQRLKDKEEEEW